MKVGQISLAATAVLGLALAGSAVAQDAHESLGPKDTPSAKGKAPLLDLLATVKASPKDELAGVHPRVYFTDAELAALRLKVHGSDKSEWQRVLTNIRALKVPPPPPPAEQRRAQNEVAMGIAEAAFAYKMEGDPKYLKAAKVYMDAAVSYDVWGYSFNKPNTDLAAGHLLYGLGVGYDLLYNDLTPAERDRYRAKLATQGHLMYVYWKTKPGRTIAYSQNHTFIPMAGLGIAAYAVYGEVPLPRMEEAQLFRLMATGVADAAAPFATTVESHVATHLHVVPNERSEFANRAVNVVVAALSLVILAPMMALVALAIKLTSRGPVFYVQTRVGMDRRRRAATAVFDRRHSNVGGRAFRIIKFRSMRVDAEQGTGAVWATRSDPRVTPVGEFLRKTRLDELPQLINVVLGDMNIVGPRPERPSIFAELRQNIESYPLRQQARPGITGWAQINRAYDSSIDDVRAKVEFDLEYLERQSVLEDLKIMARTLPVMLFKRGSC